MGYDKDIVSHLVEGSNINRPPGSNIYHFVIVRNWIEKLKCVVGHHFYATSAFGSDKWAIHYYAHIEGHELLTRRDLVPNEPDHKLFPTIGSASTYLRCNTVCAIRG